MKIFITLIICLLSININTNAYFGKPSSLDLYKNINLGINNLNNNILEIELNGGDNGSNILKEINKIAKSQKNKVCLDESKIISIEDFNKIATSKSIETLIKYFSKKCSGDYVSINLINNYLSFFYNHKENSIIASTKKSKEIYTISNIGIYSDGLVNNSGFDLIYDIQEIDKIIFADVVDYKGDSSMDLGDEFNKSIKNINDSINKILSSNLGINNKSTNNSLNNTNILNNPNIINSSVVSSNGSPYICSENINKSGLSNDSLNFLLSNIDNNTLSQENTQPNGVVDPDNNIVDNNLNQNTYTDGSYKKVTDNSLWPCTNFFCIDIDFITYQYNLFGGGENITIEYLLNRSNEHLGKFAATSLLPAKMSVNNFELGLSNINLTNLFHMGFQISSKPVPILNIQEDSKVFNNKYSSSNMLEAYYKALGLDYSRQNDLNLLNKREQNKQNLLNSQGLSIKKLTKRNNTINYSINKYTNNKISILEKNIDKKVSYGIMETFEKQFIEISNFTTSLNSYIKNMDSIISNMKEIPIDKG